MSTLDVQSPRGQVAVRDEERAVALFEQRYPNYRYCHTDKQTMAKLDGMIWHRDDRLAYLVLTSCRYDCTLDTFAGWDWEWLVTWRKLQQGAIISRYLQAPLLGFLYVVDQQTLLVQTLYNPVFPPAQRWRTPIRVDRTVTQATINGGRVMRWNAFIKIDKAQRLADDSIPLA